MDFLEVAQGLQEGNVYTHPCFSRDKYITLDVYGDIRLFDNYNLESIDFTPELVLSNEWVQCNKHTWTIVGIDYDVHLITDEVTVYYVLTRNKEEYDSWDCHTIQARDIKEITAYVRVQIDENARLSDNEKEQIKTLIKTA